MEVRSVTVAGELNDQQSFYAAECRVWNNRPTDLRQPNLSHKLQQINKYIMNF